MDRTLTVALALVLTSLTTWAAAPRMLPPLLAGGTATLRIQGDRGVSYRVEASSNLTTWVEVGAGVATEGTLSISHTAPTNTRWMYYRAAQTTSGGALFPHVVPTPSTNAQASAVVAPDRETMIRVVDRHQVIHTLSFPTGCVAVPTLVRLTALDAVSGLPNAAGLLAGTRLEPSGLVLTAPAFLQLDFPEQMDGARVSSFACDNTGDRLHLVPDVVVANLTTNRVRILVSQLRSHGSGLFTLPELQALAGTIPPPRAGGSRAGLHASLSECFPEEEADAREMNEDLEDKLRPLQQKAAAKLGEERQRQLLGVADDDAGSEALRQVMADSESFYRSEIQSLIPAALESCAAAKTLVPWALGFERQRQLLGGSEGDAGAPLANQLLCSGARRCQEQALECCRTKGGDTRLVQELLGLERQRQLLGEGAECGEISLSETLEECAPSWYGTLSITISGRYLNLATNGNWHIQRRSDSDFVLTAQVLSARVRAHEESIFNPAYTNLTMVLGGSLVASDHMEKVEENRELSCQGKPLDLRRDTWDSSVSTRLDDIELDAVIMAPGLSSLFVQPYLRVGDDDAVRDMRWFYEEIHTERGTFADEPCETTLVRTGGDYDADAGNYGFSIFAGPEEFSWTADSIHYSFQGPEPMQFDFEHLFNGVRQVTLDLRRVR
ncbi:MAG: hypothetical protein IT580_00925 [Verrucomicrobiales bacterium]|nr:hypothetical protein [Verrucomicrobiales bacterium]